MSVWTVFICSFSILRNSQLESNVCRIREASLVTDFSTVWLFLVNGKKISRGQNQVSKHQKVWLREWCTGNQQRIKELLYFHIGWGKSYFTFDFKKKRKKCKGEAWMDTTVSTSVLNSSNWIFKLSGNHSGSERSLLTDARSINNSQTLISIRLRQ